MTEVEWLTSEDPLAMLRVVDPLGPPQCSLRKLRLFAAACLRERWGWNAPTDLRPVGGDTVIRDVVESLEDFADGGDELSTIEAFQKAGALERPAISTGTVAGTRLYAQSVANIDNPVRRQARAAIMRDIFGNPFKPVMPQYGESVLKKLRDNVPYYQPFGILREDVLRWNDGMVKRIAQRIYDDRAFGDMPVLGDALLDSGCDCQDMIDHCYGVVRDLKVPCRGCGGSGFNGRGTGYDDVCDECGGQREEPVKVGQAVPCWRDCRLNSYRCSCKDGWIRVPCTRGCWVLDMILGKN